MQNKRPKKIENQTRQEVSRNNLHSIHMPPLRNMSDFVWDNCSQYEKGCFSKKNQV